MNLTMSFLPFFASLWIVLLLLSNKFLYSFVLSISPGLAKVLDIDINDCHIISVFYKYTALGEGHGLNRKGGFNI